ncbi:hypothetical protein ACJIZ3_017905 [Penstemon smallii]|uniref:Uncharacterized protein n=1 Tax=Penstemon smallii TaxID=265156 RepID=A0ABD3SXB5_9LAMI
MEKAREFLEKIATSEESALISRLTFPPHKPHHESSFYEFLTVRGVRVDRVQPGSVFCSFKVPPRLTDANGNLATGAIASLVDAIGAAVVHEDGRPMDVSVNILAVERKKKRRNASNQEPWRSTKQKEKIVQRKIIKDLFERTAIMEIQYLLIINIVGNFTPGFFDLQDELEIISTCLGKRGGYAGTNVLIRNKTTGDVVAEGRHSLFSKPTSKM